MTNPDEVDPIVLSEMPDVIDRVISAGAKPPFTYLGAGMTSIVICDASGTRAFKIARSLAPFLYRMLESEGEFLQAAAKVSGVREHIPRLHGFDPARMILGRECVNGRAGGWSSESELFVLHREIEKKMIPHGWTSPEFKGDSWVRTVDRRWILVDAGMAHRVGRALVEYADDVLHNRRLHPEPASDIAFQVYRETREGTIPEATGERLLRAFGSDEWLRMLLRRQKEAAAGT